MKIQYKNLEGSIEYVSQLKLYVGEFIIKDRVFSFSGENKVELYQHMLEQLKPYVKEGYMNKNSTPAKI